MRSRKGKVVGEDKVSCGRIWKEYKEKMETIQIMQKIITLIRKSTKELKHVLAYHITSHYFAQRKKVRYIISCHVKS